MGTEILEGVGTPTPLPPSFSIGTKTLQLCDLHSSNKKIPPLTKIGTVKEKKTAHICVCVFFQLCDLREPGKKNKYNSGIA